MRTKTRKTTSGKNDGNQISEVYLRKICAPLAEKLDNLAFSKIAATKTAGVLRSFSLFRSVKTDAFVLSILVLLQQLSDAIDEHNRQKEQLFQLRKLGTSLASQANAGIAKIKGSPEIEKAVIELSHAYKRSSFETSEDVVGSRCFYVTRVIDSLCEVFLAHPSRIHAELAKRQV